jgi:hypothetical protein
MRAQRAGMTRPVDAPRSRRIWHFEGESLCDALDDAGAWQTAVRIRVAHREALRHHPDGTAFDVRPTPEDVAPLNLALDTLRAERARQPGCDRSIAPLSPLPRSGTRPLLGETVREANSAGDLKSRAGSPRKNSPEVSHGD